jgi:hypothetical protein
VRFEFESGIVSFVFLLSLFRLENHVCLSRGVQMADVAWHAATRIMKGIGDLVQRIRDGRTGRVLGGRAIERTGGAVCSMHVEMRSAGFLVEPQNQGRWFISSLTPKPLGRFLIGLGLKTDGDGL